MTKKNNKIAQTWTEIKVKTENIKIKYAVSHLRGLYYSYS